LLQSQLYYRHHSVHHQKWFFSCTLLNMYSILKTMWNESCSDACILYYVPVSLWWAIFEKFDKVWFELNVK
jgi:hypothetical protein